MSERELRVGSGFDVHPFAEGRPLIIGGVSIPFKCGLAGHSDADVLLHAVCDALLGAAALGDIGIHFPDSDPKWKGADSRALLQQVCEKITALGWRPVNLDCTILAQVPKISPYRDEMRSTLADLLKIPLTACSVKATTTERLGFIGREEGVAASAIVLIERAAQP